MTNSLNVTALSKKALAGERPGPDECQAVLDPLITELPALINAAYAIRKKHFGNQVFIHILNNVQNGNCSQDCQYCAQSRVSRAPITAYAQKSAEEIYREAQDAYQAGAFRHCLVFSGDRLSQKQFSDVVDIVRGLKRRFPMEICVSPGFIDAQQAKALKEAGLNRLNHNLNTSRRNYSKICTSHTYADRLSTLNAAKSVGLEVCSGVIVGMGETHEDIIDVATALRELQAESIPVNFFLPIPGVALDQDQPLTPEFCLRVLCLFRFLNPAADIRIAAGREYHLRSLEVLGLYPASSLFLDGYLNAQGSSRAKTLQMIKDAGFTIRSEHGLDDLLKIERGGEKVGGRKEQTQGLTLKNHSAARNRNL